jgi:peptide/nickel transport system substrate-binding protein
MKWSQKILLAGYVLALAGMLTLPATAQQVTIALGSEPTTLDPQLREDGGERAVNDNIYETLMARDPNGNLVPGLAAGTPGLVDPQKRQTDHRSEI